VFSAWVILNERKWVTFGERRGLEEENAKLKRIVADQALDITMLKDLLGKEW
jgi:hypothetical protein